MRKWTLFSTRMRLLDLANFKLYLKIVLTTSAAALRILTAIKVRAVRPHVSVNYATSVFLHKIVLYI